MAQGGAAQAQQEKKMAIVLSHHNSVTLENAAEPVIGGQTLYHADEFISMLREFPTWWPGSTGTHTSTRSGHMAMRKAVLLGNHLSLLR